MKCDIEIKTPIDRPWLQLAVCDLDHNVTEWNGPVRQKVTNAIREDATGGRPGPSVLVPELLRNHDPSPPAGDYPNADAAERRTKYIRSMTR
jgi:hypothetical protein